MDPATCTHAINADRVVSYVETRLHLREKKQYQRGEMYSMLSNVGMILRGYVGDVMPLTITTVAGQGVYRLAAYLPSVEKVNRVVWPDTWTMRYVDRANIREYAGTGSVSVWSMYREHLSASEPSWGTVIEIQDAAQVAAGLTITLDVQIGPFVDIAPGGAVFLPSSMEPVLRLALEAEAAGMYAPERETVARVLYDKALHDWRMKNAYRQHAEVTQTDLLRF